MKEIQTTHNKEGIIATDEWYTPLEFIEQFGKFDVDPCVPINMKWKTAEVMYNKNDDGLSKEWEGRVWLNPPYSKELISAFLKKMGEHKNGIALVLPKFTSKLFREEVFLGCWCHPKLCHGDVIKQKLEQRLVKEKLKEHERNSNNA